MARKTEGAGEDGRGRSLLHADEISDKSSALRPPSEAWLLRTLAELRREQRFPSVRVDRPAPGLRPRRRWPRAEDEVKR
jgi:hypothetical protein